MTEKTLTVKKFDTDFDYYMWQKLSNIAKDRDCLYTVIEKTGGHMKRKSVTLQELPDNNSDISGSWIKVRLVTDPRFITVECRVETVNSNLVWKVPRNGSMHEFLQDFLNGWDNK